MHRGLTPLTLMYYQAAKAAHLSCPLGRALVLTSRHYNDGYGALRMRWRGAQAARLGELRAVSPERAQRWLAHWRDGGSLKALRLSRTQYLVGRQADRLRDMMYHRVYKPQPHHPSLEQLVKFYKLRGEV